MKHNGNYEPNNCRWVDYIIQANNKTTNHIIEYKGKTYTISEISRILKNEFPTFKYNTLRNYVRNNKTIYDYINYIKNGSRGGALKIKYNDNFYSIKDLSKLLNKNENTIRGWYRKNKNNIIWKRV